MTLEGLKNESKSVFCSMFVQAEGITRPSAWSSTMRLPQTDRGTA